MFYGAQYFRPPFPFRDCWERDFENMRSLGFNYVKLWAVWNFIETAPGVFDFSDLDDLVDLAGKYGLAVVINLIPEGAPYWTFKGDREDLYQTADGQYVDYGGPANIPSAGWPGRCSDDPVFTDMVASFIERTAAHFAGRKEIIAFDVWNEPHLEPMYDYRTNMLCYCRHSKKAFVEWLKKKYGSLDALGTAWYRKYGEWSQVEPPTRFGTWADMLDWRKFWLGNMSRWLQVRVDACRKGAPGIKVQTHVAYSGILGNKLTGGLANELGDEFKLSRQVDLFGLSSFPKWLMGEEHYYRHLLHNEMISEASGKIPFYQVELQGGAGKPGLLGGEVPTAADVRVWNYNTVACGGKGSVYWQYAPEPSGVESPGFGLTGFRGENTPRSLSASKCARELNTEILDRARKISPVNAVYVSRKSDLLCFSSERREEMYAGSLSGIFKAAYRNCIPVRFFHEDNLSTLTASGVRILYLPMPLVLDTAEVEALDAFVLNGGTLVSEACPGLYASDGLLDFDGSALKRLFNLTHVEVQGIKDWGEVRATLSGCGSFTGRFYRQLVLPGEGVSVLATFDDGEPAVTEFRHGKGRAVWIGTYPSYHHEHSGDAATAAFLSGLLDAGGYAQISSISATAAASTTVTAAAPSFGAQHPVKAPVVRLLETVDELVLVAVNHQSSPVDVTVRFRDFREPVCLHLEAEDGNVVQVPRTGK